MILYIQEQKDDLEKDSQRMENEKTKSRQKTKQRSVGKNEDA